MKAVIPVAGLGTRFLPATKAVPKELLPVLDKPVIQYVVEEALHPDEVDGVVLVNSHDKPQIEEYFSHDRKLEGILRERGKEGLADAVSDVADLPVEFAYQDEPRGLGHAVACARDMVGDEPFLVLLGDYFVPGKGMCPDMIRVSEEHGGCSVIAVAPVSEAEVSRYGIIAGEPVTAADSEEGPDAPGAVWRVTGMVEKPSPEEAPSNLFIVGRYLLTPRIMELLATQEAGAGGEVQLTDAMLRLLEEEEMYALVVDRTDGCDTGTPEAWAGTNALMCINGTHEQAEAFWESLLPARLAHVAAMSQTKGHRRP